MILEVLEIIFGGVGRVGAARDRPNVGRGGIVLPETVLEQLTRNTELCQPLVEMAWPNLSTESRLQVIQAIQCDSVMSYTPHWLTKLALDDPAPIVRYWAARHAYLKKDRSEHCPEERKGLIWLFPPVTDEEKQLYANASSDPCKFVRFCCISTGDTRQLGSLSQLERLLHIRHLDGPNLLSFVEWLEQAVAAGVPDSDLRACAGEFFMHPRVQKDIKRKEIDFTDGGEAHLCGKGMRKGWALTKSAGPKLRAILAYALPTSYGLGTIKVGELAELPDDVLEIVINRVEPSNEIIGVVGLMGERPELFSSKVLEKLQRHDEYGNGVHWSPEELDDHRRRQAVNRSEVTLEAVLELRRQLAELREYLQETMREAAARKRGIFG